MRFFKSCPKSVNAIEDLGRAGREQVMTAFQVGNLGFYEFNHMPFGLCNSPAIFQRLMERCMGEMNQRDCLFYLDDIIFFSTNFEEHLDKSNNHLKLKGSKCDFSKSQVFTWGILSRGKKSELTQPR